MAFAYTSPKPGPVLPAPPARLAAALVVLASSDPATGRGLPRPRPRSARLGLVGGPRGRLRQNDLRRRRPGPDGPRGAGRGATNRPRLGGLHRLPTRARACRTRGAIRRPRHPAALVRPLRLRHLALPLFASYQVLLATPALGPRAMTGGRRFIRTLIRAGSAAPRSGPSTSLTPTRTCSASPPAPRPAPPATEPSSPASYRPRFATATGRPTFGFPRCWCWAAPARCAGRSTPSRARTSAWKRSRARDTLPEEAPDRVLALAAPFLAEG